MRCIESKNIRTLIKLASSPIMDFSFLWNNPSNHLSVILTKEDDTEIKIDFIGELYDYYRYYDDNKISNPITIIFDNKDIYDKIISESPTIKKIQIITMDKNNTILSTEIIDKTFYFQFGEFDTDDENNLSYSITFGRNVK